jgi:hypothetical protein
MALDNLRGIVQTVRERRRGTQGRDIWGEGFAASELRHDIDEGEDKGT